MARKQITLRFDETLKTDLERAARERSLKDDTRVSWVDLLHEAGQRLLRGDANAAPEGSREPPAGFIEDPRALRHDPRSIHRPRPTADIPRRTGLDAQSEVYLLPNCRDESTRPLSLTLDEWETAHALCIRGGYTPPDHAYMSRDAVRYFKRGLEQAVRRGWVAEDAKAWVEPLIAFCDGDGAGGFEFTRTWKSARSR